MIQQFMSTLIKIIRGRASDLHAYVRLEVFYTMFSWLLSKHKFGEG